MCSEPQPLLSESVAKRCEAVHTCEGARAFAGHEDVVERISNRERPYCGSRFPAITRPARSPSTPPTPIVDGDRACRSACGALAALLIVLTQQLAGFSIDQMYPGAGRTGDRLILVFGNIWIVIQLVLDVEAGRRAPENEMAHSVEIDGPAAPDHDLAQGSP
jgi:hypothetical protein